MSYKFNVSLTENSRLASLDFKNIPFGHVFSDHMFVADYADGEWKNFEILPFGYIPMHPANLAIHYGQSIFEGMKASKMHDGTPALFRAEMHVHRINASARRMCMPELPEKLFLQAVETLVDIDRDWIPPAEGSSLYVRPFMFACDEALGVRASKKASGAGRKAPRGQHGRAKRSSSRAKRANGALTGGEGAQSR